MSHTTVIPTDRPPDVFRKFARALVVVAHPDDPEFLFGATIAKLAHDEVSIGYVICSNGANGSRDLAVTSADLTRRRYAEQRAAAALLGVGTVTFLEFADGRLAPTFDLRLAIAREIRRIKPDLVLTHYPQRILHLPIEASHPDHVAVGDATLSAIYPDAANGRAWPELLAEGLAPHRVREIWVPGYEHANHFVDATPFLERKLEAIRCHRSQLGASPVGDVPAWVADWMRRSGQRAGCEYAEEFRRIALV